MWFFLGSGRTPTTIAQSMRGREEIKIYCCKVLTAHMNHITWRCVVVKMYTGIPCFIVLHCIGLHRYCIFYELKVCGNLASSKSTGTIFPTAFVHFVSLCHIWIILAVFQTPSLLLYLLWWSVICDIWCYYYDSLKAQMMVSIF